MSEFSESYHLRSERAEDAVELLRRANLRGYVFQPSNGWVTFLAENGAFKPNQQIVRSSRHPLLHYVAAEDHGWGFSLFHQGKPACSYKCEWDPGITVEDREYSRDDLQRLVSSTDPILLQEFERDMRPTGHDDLLGADLAKTFARAVGLEHYDWIAFHYVERDFRFAPTRRPDVIVVN